MSYEKLNAERDALEARVHGLEETLAELKVSADQGQHYKQITTEMEERVSALEKELLQTAQKVGYLEKLLEESNNKLSIEQSKNDKLANKLRRLSVAETPKSVQSDADAIKERLLADLETKQRVITEAKTKEQDLLLQLQNEQNEKRKLLDDLSQMEDRFITMERQTASSIFQLKHNLTVTKSDLEACKEYILQLEKERQNLCTKLHVKPDPNIGFEDSRGGGTFQDAPSMSDVSCRNGLSAIDTLYLKNVLFKFLEAVHKDKKMERDMLLPAISTILGASPEEFGKLRQTISSESTSTSRSGFSFWF